MFLLNVVYIYDLSLITPLFLPAARCFVLGRGTAMVYMYSVVWVFNFRCMFCVYAGGLGIRNLG